MPLSQIVAHLRQILNESAGEQPLSSLTEKLYKLPGSKLALQNQGCKMRALIEKYPDLFVYIDDGGGGKVRLADNHGRETCEFGVRVELECECQCQQQLAAAHCSQQ